MATNPDDTDPFELLGLAPSFDIDAATLGTAYLALVARLHPDIAQGDAEASRRSAAANRARSVLEDPELRAGALLKRLGGPSKEADRSLPPGFLADILELREEIEAAQTSGDPLQVEKWRVWAATRRTEYVRQIADLFRRCNTAAPDPAPLLKEVRMELNAWRYVERLIEQLEPGYDPAHADFRDSPGI